MTEHTLTPMQIQAFARHLQLEEKSAATIEKYLRDVRAYAITVPALCCRRSGLIKPEDGKAYYVINGKATGDIEM